MSKFLVWATKKDNPNAIKGFVEGFKTLEEAQNYCKYHHYKINYFGAIKLDLIIEEV